VFVIRQSKPEDAPTLQKLARMVYFINLPPAERLILEKIEHSQRCFRKLATGAPTESRRQEPRRSKSYGSGLSHMQEESDLFMFTIMDTEAGVGGVLGTSQVRAKMGGPGNPNWAFKITEKTFRSEQLGVGTTHRVGQLYGDESSPTEVGGLILTPSHRGHPARPGRFLSFVRFHFMGLFRSVFSDRVIAEMAPPVTPDGENLFWDAFGRKFIPVKYAEADRFCQHNRAFISELLPKEEIYLSLLPLEVQNQIGAVSRETVPARKLLESLGFSYRGFVDPFDTGPHLEADTDKISLVAQTRRLVLGKPTTPDRCTTPAMISAMTGEGEFRAMETNVELDGEGVRVPRHVMERLLASPGMQVGFTPMSDWVRTKGDATGEQASGDASASERAGTGKSRKPRAKAKSKRVRS
jgi:arginine N-succinyltransferase